MKYILTLVAVMCLHLSSFSQSVVWELCGLNVSGCEACCCNHPFPGDSKWQNINVKIHNGGKIVWHAELKNRACLGFHSRLTVEFLDDRKNVVAIAQSPAYGIDGSWNCKDRQMRTIDQVTYMTNAQWSDVRRLKYARISCTKESHGPDPEAKLIINGIKMAMSLGG